VTEVPQVTAPEPANGRRETGLFRDIWASISTDEVAARVLVTGCATLAVGWLGIKEAIGAVVFSQIFTEAVKKIVERAKPGTRKTWLVILLLFLLQLGQRALAAVRSLFRSEPPAPRPALTGLRASAVATAVATVVAVGAITVPELALGHSLVSDRRTTLFSGEPVPEGNRLRPVPQKPFQPPAPTPSPSPSSATTPSSPTAAPRTTPSAPVRPTSTPARPPAGPASEAPDATPPVVAPAGRTKPPTKMPPAGRKKPVPSDAPAKGEPVPPPQLLLPKPPRVEATGSQGALAVFAVTASLGNVSCSPPSGSLFPIGTTSVTCTASAGGRTSSATFDVSVVDETPPKLTLPGRIEREIRAGSAVVTYPSSAVDVVDGSLAPACTPESGSKFALGETTVRCFASDTRGNRVSDSFVVRLTKAPPGLPKLEVPANIVKEATGPDGTEVTFATSAKDDSGNALEIRCSRVSGSVFPLGTTTVKCRAAAPGGPEATGAFDVTVLDTTAPRFTPPQVEPVEAASGNGALVKFTVPAADVVSTTLVVTCSPESGALFPIGTTTVECSIADRARNVARGSFAVKVFDGAPRLELPGDITTDYDPESPRGTSVRYKVTATDRVDGQVDPTCSLRSGSRRFQVGTTTVVCTARDSAGQEVTGSFTVTVLDRVAPALTVPDSFSVTAPPGLKRTRVGFEATASDVIDGDVPVVCDPRAGSAFPVGETTTVTCRAKDNSGNVIARQFTITVEPGIN
jgi:hypothetical protein